MGLYELEAALPITQVKMLSRQMYGQARSSGERAELEIYIWELSAYIGV